MATDDQSRGIGVSLATFDRTGFDRGASVVKEFAWLLLRQCFFMHYPLRGNCLRRGLLRGFGASVGTGVVIKPEVKITFPWKLRVGDHSWLGEEAWILNLAPVTIGANVCISQRALLCTGNHDWSQRRFPLVTRPITIQDGAWICAQVFVGPGVTVGRNTVVTTGSVVTHDLPPDMICSGNPCQPVKRRIMAA